MDVKPWQSSSWPESAGGVQFSKLPQPQPQPVPHQPVSQSSAQSSIDGSMASSYQPKLPPPGPPQPIQRSMAVQSTFAKAPPITSTHRVGTAVETRESWTSPCPHQGSNVARPAAGVGRTGIKRPPLPSRAVPDGRDCDDAQSPLGVQPWDSPAEEAVALGLTGVWLA